MNIKIKTAQLTGEYIKTTFDLTIDGSVGDVSLSIDKQKLINFILEQELNIYASNTFGVTWESIHPVTYLINNLNKIVELYVLDKMKED